MTGDRDGCCDGWPRPCTYHEGWQDALDGLPNSLLDGLRDAGAGDRTGNPCHGDRPLVYVAHPMTCYGTTWETEALAVIARRLPGAELVDPASRYSSSAAWLCDWPLLVGALSGLVVFADEDGRIGAGVLREVADALAHAVPVALLDDGRLCELAGLDLVTPEDRTPAAAAYVVGGAPAEGFARATP